MAFNDSPVLLRNLLPGTRRSGSCQSGCPSLHYGPRDGEAPLHHVTFTFAHGPSRSPAARRWLSAYPTAQRDFLDAAAGPLLALLRRRLGRVVEGAVATGAALTEEALPKVRTAGRTWAYNGSPGCFLAGAVHSGS